MTVVTANGAVKPKVAIHMRRFPSLTMEVEVTAGTPIEMACHELVELANFMGFVITAKFNGVLVMAHPDGNPEWLHKNWESQLASKFPHKIAVSYRLDPSSASETQASQDSTNLQTSQVVKDQSRMSGDT